MSFISSIGPYVNSAAQIATGLERGSEQRDDLLNQRALQAYQIQRQQQQDALQQQIFQRQQQQQEQDSTVKNALQGVFKNTPVTPDPVNRVYGERDPNSSISRPEMLAKMERAPIDTSASSAVPLPKVDPAQVHQSIVDQSRIPIPGTDQYVNYDQSLTGYKQRQQDDREQMKEEAALTRERVKEPAFHQPTIGSPEWEAAETFKAGLRAPAQDHYQPVTVSAADGSQHVARFNSKTGQIEDTGMGAKAGAQGKGGVDKQTDKQRSLDTYASLMERSLPIIQQYAHSVRPLAISAAMYAPVLGNTGLTPEEQKYIQALRDFSAGVNHQESGARVSKEQMKRDYLRHGVVMGDDPATIDQKIAAVTQKTQEARAAAGPHRGATTGASQKKTVPDQAAYDELRTHFTADQIRQRYALAPGIQER